MGEAPKIAVILVAAGSGQRAGGAKPKQYQMLAGKALATHALDMFLAHEAITHIQPVIADDHAEWWVEATPHRATLPPVEGGATRQDSVRAGLEALEPHAPDYVLIHDAARPFISAALINRLLDAVSKHEAVIPSMPLADTIKRREGEQVGETLDRDTLIAVQTPQAFAFATVREAHRAQTGQALTDDAAVMEASGHPVFHIAGEAKNRKITTAEDMLWAQMQFSRSVRIGQGFDVHKLVPSEGTMRLCGIDLESDVMCEGHSDADVGLHAIVDALLGAIAAGDIGQHFPPSDPQWKGCDSTHFVQHAKTLVEQAGGIIRHVDLTIIGEKPKVNPHRDAMREKIAELLQMGLGQVSVKATTTEKLGFTGRGEGIAAQAVATIEVCE